MEVIKELGWLPVLVLLTVATIVAGVILKVSRGNKGAVGIDAGRADLRPVLPNFIWRGNL